MSGLLAEMNCPYASLTSGDVTKRLHNQKNCLLLLSKLKGYLQANLVLCKNQYCFLHCSKQNNISLSVLKQLPKIMIFFPVIYSDLSVTL